MLIGVLAVRIALGSGGGTADRRRCAGPGRGAAFGERNAVGAGRRLRLYGAVAGLPGDPGQGTSTQGGLARP
ncbi:hypothetical protein [Streptomyces sp. NPDC051665]|uniref:hypothetical protein n=1 Tax=Streptomyces sp. NPDC051665 TaxID=3154647 RepID=UPI00344A2DC2